MANQSKSFYLQEIKKYKGDVDKYSQAISSYTNNSVDDQTLSMKALDEYRYEERNKNNSSKIDYKGFTEKVTGIQSLNYSVASSSFISEKPELLAGAINSLVGILTSDKSGKEKENEFGTSVKKILGGIVESVFDGGTDILEKEVKLRNDINSSIGISGQLSRDFRNEIMESLPSVESMGYGFEDLSSTVIKTMEQTGRFSLMNKETMEKMAVTSRAFIGDMESSAKLVRDFELLGIGNEEAFDNINKIGQSSLNIGLQARKVVSETQTNLSKINQYGFQNGINGLSRMVQKSIEFRMGMESAFQLADKVFSPEGAIELSANLQAIGGAVGDLNDPLKLMYMATNNVEGLQDALIGVAGSLATYNTEQGRFEITGINLRRAKDLANELGISYNELANGAIAAAERSSAAIDLLSSGLKLEDKEKEFLTNISRMEGGKMVIDIPQSLAQKLGIEETRVALENLDQNTAAALLENQKYFETLSPEEIAREQYSATQQLELSVREITTMLKVRFASAARIPLQNADEYIKGLSDMINPVGKKIPFSGTLEGITNDMSSLFENLFDVKSLSSMENRTVKNMTINHIHTFNNDVGNDELINKTFRNPKAVETFNDKFNNFFGYGSKPYGN
jgi:hypothetical protein